MSASKRSFVQDDEEHVASKKRRNEDEDHDLDSSQSLDIESVTPRDAGIIEQVSLKNFMNHTRLDFRFGPQINFVIGRNGSGKSAVVTALVVGLGGKATVTSRGSSVKGFIKTGKQMTEVTIKLRNKGTDAFKHDSYGDSIVVERKINADGSSQYKLKGKDGKLVSNKREELDRILDQFNIQVDNPIAILNQETSKNFLHSKNPKDRYKFFLKATQLEQMKHDYATANEEKHITKDIIDQKSKSLPALLSEVTTWEQQFKALGSLEKLKDKVRKLKDELAWAIVAEKEKEMEPLEKQHRFEEAKLPKFEDKVVKAKASADRCTQEHNDVQQKLKEMDGSVGSLQTEYETAKKELREKKNTLRKSETDVRRARGELGNLEGDRNMILQRIKELRNSAKQDCDAERQLRESKIEALEEELNTLKAQKNTTEHQQDQFQSCENKAKEESYNLRSEVRDVKKKLDDVQGVLRDLEASRSNRLKRFGDFVPKTVADIEAAHRQGKFHQKPKGPIGAFIQVKEEMWALGVESCLKSLIHAYCCHDYHDERILQDILKRTYPRNFKPSIIVSKFRDQVYDISSHKAQTEFATVYDMLDIKEGVITNTLINERSIESVILIKENDKARHIMKNRAPRNCNQAFTLTGDQIIKEPTFRSYACFSDQAKYLGKNVDSQISKLKGEESEHGKQLSNLTQRLRQADDSAKKNHQEARKCMTQVMKLIEKINDAQGSLIGLKNVEDPIPVDVTTLEEDVLSLDQQIEQVKTKMDELSEKLQHDTATCQQSEDVFKETDLRMKEIADSVEPLKEQLAEVEENIKKAEYEKRHYIQKQKEQEKKLKDAKEELGKAKRDVEETVAKALKVCQQISTRRTVKSLENEISQIVKQIQAEEKQRGSADEITRKYHETKETYMQIKKEISSFKNFIDKLGDMMKERQKQYFDLRRFIALRARYYFIAMLHNRGYTGKMTFDHPSESLELQVQPTSGHEEGTKDMRSLSGGERSFSTVCFILSLWEAMESPFRCLDEFDVYMDMVNRRVSMEMMMEEARLQRHRQFIFLTPLDMTQLPQSEAIRIFKMPDPKRGQGVLPFGSQPNDHEEGDTN